MIILDTIFSSFKWYRKHIGGTWWNLLDWPNVDIKYSYWSRKLWNTSDSELILNMEKYD